MSCGNGEVGIVGKGAVKTFVYRSALGIAGGRKRFFRHVKMLAFAVAGRSKTAQSIINNNVRIFFFIFCPPWEWGLFNIHNICKGRIDYVDLTV